MPLAMMPVSLSVLCSLSSSVWCPVKMFLAPAAILNVFCLSGSLLDICLGVLSFTLTDLSLPPPLPLSLSPFALTHPCPHPPEFRHSPSLSPFPPIVLTPPLFSSSLLPSTINSHLSTFPLLLFCPCSHSLTYTVVLILFR